MSEMDEISTLHDRRATVISVTADLQKPDNNNPADHRKPGCMQSKYCRKTLQPYIITYFLLSAYIFLGALVFQVLESTHQQETINRVGQLRTELLENFRNACSLNDANWTSRVNQMMEDFEDEMEHAFQQGMSVRSGYTWDYFASCFFCLTVVSTIGYGHMTPKTTAGRLLCTFYAVIGIPLYFLYLAKLGDLIATPLRKIYRRSVLSIRKIRLRNKLRRSYNMEDRQGPTYDTANNASQLENQMMQEAIEDGLQPTAFDNDLSLLRYKQIVYRNDVCMNDEDAVVDRDAERRIVRRSTVETISESVCTERNDVSFDEVCVGDLNGDVYHSAAESLDDLRSAHRVARTVRTVADNDYAATRTIGVQTQQNFACNDDDVDDGSDGDDADSHKVIADDAEEIGTTSNVHTGQFCEEGDEQSQLGAKNLKFRMKPAEDVPLTFLVVLLILYICIGAAVFASSENWSFTEAIYFCTITFTTVGFGDLIPVYNTEDPISQQALIAAFIITGMVMMSSCLSLSQDRIRCFARKMFGRDDIPRQVKP